jgi:hypothetical protein
MILPQFCDKYSAHPSGSRIGQFFGQVYRQEPETNKNGHDARVPQAYSSMKTAQAVFNWKSGTGCDENRTSLKC